MHDLMWVYANELVYAQESEAVRRNAFGWLFDWYLRTANAARDLLDPVYSRLACTAVTRPKISFGSRAAAPAWLKAEWANLVAIMRAST